MLKNSQMDFNLSRLRSFMVVARLGNLSAAAKELGTTQPNLGRQMTALAKELELELFVRHSRGVELTEQGREFFEVCQDIVGQLAQRRDMIREKSSEVQGKLRILTGVGSGQIILDHIHTLSLKFPKLCFEISSVADVFEFKIGDADVGIILSPSSDPDMIQHHLFDMEMKIYASPDYLKEHGSPRTLEDLYYHNMIMYKAETQEITQSINTHLTGDTTKDLQYNNLIQVNNGIALRKALINGLGIGNLWYEKDLLDQNLLVDVFPDMPSRKIPYYYTYHRRLDGTPKVKAFHDFLNDIYKPFQP